MADILKIRAKKEGNGLIWEIVGSSKANYKIKLDQAPTVTINDGDIWHVEAINIESQTGSRQKVATVRLIARVQTVQSWQKIKSLKDFWMSPINLESILIWLHTGTDIILKGPKGSGKTTFPFALARALGWQDPYKVDVYTIKRTTDLFGTDAASDGSTFFVRSGLMDYIERATIALEQGLDTHFIIILDEINRVHAKVNESLHGLFDDTRQVTIPTAEGSKIIRLPSNLHTFGTMNSGANYLGTHGIDEALKDRFEPINVKLMPIDYEVKKLAKETGILESQALSIVQVSRLLHEAATGGQLSFGPSYRACRNTARLVLHGMGMKTAVIQGFLGWYEGETELNEQNEMVQPNSEVAKAFSVLRMKGIANAKDLV